jgi:hypothetical protein
MNALLFILHIAFLFDLTKRSAAFRRSQCNTRHYDLFTTDVGLLYKHLDFVFKDVVLP